MQEEIKGWKHAVSDLAKHRSGQGKTIKLVALKKNGEESKLHDAITMHNSEEEARRHHNNRVRLNPGKNISHNMHVGNECVKLSEEVLDELSSNLLNRYKKTAVKARNSAFGKAEQKGENYTSSNDHDSQEWQKRNRGLDRATSKTSKRNLSKNSIHGAVKVKATNEEVLDEATHVIHMLSNGKPAGRMRISAIDDQNAQWQAKNMMGKKPYRGYSVHKVERITEDAPANAVGGGAVAGMGKGPMGEPGVSPKAMAAHKKRNKQQVSIGRKTFSQFMKGV